LVKKIQLDIISSS